MVGLGPRYVCSLDIASCFLCLVSLCALKCVMKVDNSWIVVQAGLKMEAL
jgi:hypothetical protein